MTSILPADWDSVPEVDELDLVVRCEDDVLGLDVTMSKTCAVQLVEGTCNVIENVATIRIGKSSRVIKEVNELDSLHVFHEEVAYIRISAVLLLPLCVLDELIVLWHCFDLVLVDEIHLSLCVLHKTCFLCDVRLKDLHCVLMSALLHQFDYSIAAFAKRSDYFESVATWSVIDRILP